MFTWKSDKPVFLLGVSSRMKGDKQYYNLNYYDNGYTHTISCSADVYTDCVTSGLEKCNVSMSGNIVFWAKGVFLSCTSLKKVD